MARVGRSVDGVEDCGIWWSAVVERGATNPDRPSPGRVGFPPTSTGGRRMFLGEHQHSLDAKGRVILPARFRDQLEGGAVMARGLDGCLVVYPPDRVRPRRPQAAGAARARARASARPPARSSPARPTSRPTSRAGSRSRSPCASTPASTARSWWPAGSTTSRSGTPQRFRERDAEGAASILDGEGIDDFM